MSKEKRPGAFEPRETLKPWEAIVLQSVNVIDALGYEREAEKVLVREANWDNDDAGLHFRLTASGREYENSTATDFRLSIAQQLTRAYQVHYSYNNYSKQVFQFDNNKKEGGPLPRKRHDEVLAYLASAHSGNTHLILGSEEQRQFYELAANFALQDVTSKRTLGRRALQPIPETARAFDHLMHRMYKKEPMLSEGDIRGAIFRYIRNSQ